MKQKSGIKRKKLVDDGIDSDDILSDDDSIVGKSRDDDTSEEEEETQEEKRLRLAKKYLDELKKYEEDKADAQDIDRDAIAHRLKEDALEQAGTLQKNIADKLIGVKPTLLHTLKGHKLPITCMIISSDDKYLFSASKDCSIIKWNLETGKKVKIIHGGRKGTEDTHKGHTAHILAISISSDNKFLVSGCSNSVIHVWNPETLELIHTFKGHRNAISGLAFRKNTHQLFSCSHDRSVKVWNLDDMTYVETLFGHQDQITAVDSLTREICVTAGGRDNTIRIWKIVEESQLVFQGHGSSIDCLRLINEQHFLSGSEDGSLAVWTAQKKKPILELPAAHGCSISNGEPNWISSVTAIHNTDLLASGSQNGTVKIWKWENSSRKLGLLIEIPVIGFVNALQFTSSGNHIIAGAGQEHRLGRWWRIKEAKNFIYVYLLSNKAIV